jgi:hypothetical protein
MSAPFDVGAALKLSFLALYALLFVIGISTCFFGVRAVRTWRRGIYFVSLFVLTNFILLPLCWILFKVMPGFNDKIVLGALALVATYLAWRVSGLSDLAIVQVYGALVGILIGILAGALLGSTSSNAWIMHGLWIAGGVAGALFARVRPALSQIVFFSASGAAIASQSLLGAYELLLGKSVPEVAIARLMQFFVPILYVIFSGFGVTELLFWLATLALFVVGLRTQIAQYRAVLDGATVLPDRTGEPLPVGGRFRRLIGRS